MSQHDDGVRLRHILDAAKQAIAGTRDRLVHAYFDVDLERLWQIVAVDLPPLVVVLEGAIAAGR